MTIIDTNRARTGRRATTRIGCLVSLTVPVGGPAPLPAGTVCVFAGDDEVPGWYRLTVRATGRNLHRVFGYQFIETDA